MPGEAFPEDIREEMQYREVHPADRAAAEAKVASAAERLMKERRREQLDRELFDEAFEEARERLLLEFNQTKDIRR